MQVPYSNKLFDITTMEIGSEADERSEGRSIELYIFRTLSSWSGKFKLSVSTFLFHLCFRNCSDVVTLLYRSTEVCWVYWSQNYFTYNSRKVWSHFEPSLMQSRTPKEKAMQTTLQLAPPDLQITAAFARPYLSAIRQRSPHPRNWIMPQRGCGRERGWPPSWTTDPRPKWRHRYDQWKWVFSAQNTPLQT